MDGLNDPRSRPWGAECEALYRAHATRLGQLARLLLRDPEEAREVVQETFIKVLRAWDTGQKPDQWGPWLTRLTVNACRDRYRSGWWRLWRRHMPPVDSLQVIDLQPSPEREAIGGEVRDRVWAVFQRLPARQREVVALRHFEGWSTEEIASSLGVTSGSVKRHLFRAVQRLRAALGEQR